MLPFPSLALYIVRPSEVNMKMTAATVVSL